jgi:uncharacterized protein YecE (DUF72 family)
LAIVGRFFVGTSGYASPSMRDAVETASGAAPDLLGAYSARMRAVELDSVFQRAPSPETVDSWQRATPEDFTFTVRVPREVTHVERLGMPSRVSDFIASLAHLGDQLGCLLFTTPPAFDCDVGRFAAVLDRIPEGLRTAWEFRHPSWLCPDVLSMLAGRNSAPAVSETFDQAAAAELLPGGAFADHCEFDFVYVRFRRERYTYADLVVWGEILGDALGEGRDVYAFFHQSPEALSYAQALGELLAEVHEATFSRPVRLAHP